MFIFFQAIFIAVIILHQNNIWVTLIPYPTPTFIIVGIPLFCLGLIRSDFFFRKPPRLAFIVLAGMLVFQLLSSMEVGEIYTGRYFSIVGYSMLTILCLGIISQWRQEQERYAIKLYVVISTVMAFLGFSAWLIINITWISNGVFDPTHFIDLEQFSGGRMTRSMGEIEWANRFGISENTYSFPYSLGLVLTGSYMYEFAGIPFFRASGWFHEPVSTWFMTIPAMVLIVSDSLFSKSIRRVLMTVQILFLIAAFSVSIVLSLVLIYVFRQILHSFRVASTPTSTSTSTSTSTLKAVMLVAMMGAGFWVLYVLAADYDSSYSKGLNVVLSKLSANNYLAIALDAILHPTTILPYMYLFGIAIMCAWKAQKYQNNSLMAFSLIVTCLLIVTLKGNFFHILKSPGFYILFFLMLRHREEMLFSLSHPTVR